jgi:1,4-dihydroxy-2-naphthoate octaprenyltransferase
MGDGRWKVVARSREQGAGGLIRGQRSEIRDQRSGAVRTSVTLLGQNMGNTWLLIVYTLFVAFAVLFGQIAATFLQFIQSAICPNKTARRQIHLAQKEPPKPNFHQVLSHGFKPD